MSTRRTFCGILFWTKAFLALIISWAIMGYMSWRIYVLRSEAPFRRVINLNDTECRADRGGFARLDVTDTEGVMMGFHLDWARDIPVQLESRFGRRPAIITTFMQLDPTVAQPYPPDMLNWFGSEVQRINGILQVTLEPVVPMAQVPDSVLEQFALQCKDINEKMGVPLMIRYGHEMNGGWTIYGQRPVAYVTGFRRLAEIMHRTTNLTAMVWAPNVGIFYPFGDNGSLRSPLPTAASDPTEFAALDTNRDGVINRLDDPYGPYYPGDEWVDWVGISLYHYPSLDAAGLPINAIPQPTQFQDYILGRGPSVECCTTDQPIDLSVRDFYGRFAAGRSKPMMIAEGGAPFVRGRPDGDGEVAVKQAWWRQMLEPSVHKQFPLLKAVVNFEEQKLEDGFIRDWTITINGPVRDAFLADIPRFENGLLFSDQLDVRCNGIINVRR
ncbi:hypothetical protein HK102_002476 [Quaeritorhiza haematococci]|nr:hypothetical protein HK102_002476 [Quaeritorhiza haematococci]